MAGQSQGDVAIANQALGKVGGNRITAFTDGSTEANLVSDLYGPTRDQLLSAVDWSFARIRHRLTPLLDKPLGYEYAYLVPVDVVVVREVYLSERSEVQVPRWDVETNELDQALIVADPAGNQPAIYTRSTRLVGDPSRFTPLFVSAMVSRLAAELAIPVAQSQSLARMLWREYESKLPEASSSDGQQGRSKRVNATSLTRVRGRGGSGPFVYGPPVPGA